MRDATAPHRASLVAVMCPSNPAWPRQVCQITRNAIVRKMCGMLIDHPPDCRELYNPMSHGV